MGKMFKKLTTDGIEEAQDRLGSNYDPVPTDVYEVELKIVYVGHSANSDSTSVTVVAQAGASEIKETLWITTGKGDNFYYDKNDKTKKIPMASFTIIDDLCLLTTGEGLAEQDTEEKLVKIYDPAERKEVPKPTQVLTALTGQKVKLGILRQIVDKQKKDDSGTYQNTGETRTENTIDKVFHAETGRTVNEYKHETANPEFMEAWLAKNKGKDRNKAKGAGNGAGGAGVSGTGRPGAAAAGDAPKKKLFGK